MANQRFRLSLTGASLPLDPRKAARAVMIPGLDQQQQPRVAGVDPAKVNNVQAQILLMRNMMPVREGLRSMTFTTRFENVSGETNMDRVHTLIDANSDAFMFVPAHGKNYVRTVQSPTWRSAPFGQVGIPTIPAIEASSPNTAANAVVTSTTVEGFSFACYSRLTSTASRTYTFTGTYNTNATALTVQVLSGVFNVTYTLGTSPELTTSGTTWTLIFTAAIAYDPSGALVITHTVAGSPVVTTQSPAFGTDSSLLEYNVALDLMLPAYDVTNLPFAAGTIDGIASSNGYLLMWSDLTIAWAPFNSDTSSFDWELYRNGNYTGAGYQIPEAINANIKAVVSVAGGFIMFTERNAVAAQYNANNIVAPWVFREIPGAGGVQGVDQVTTGSSLGFVYAYTSAGMQKISLNSAEIVFPELSDYVVSGKDISILTSSLSPYYGSATVYGPLIVRVTCIANKYLVVSTVRTPASPSSAPTLYTQALIYDLALDRWGKLELGFSDCFDDPFAADDAESRMCLLAPGGSASTVRWAIPVAGSSSDGIVLLGRIQLSRSRNTQITRVEVEGVVYAVYSTLAILPSYDGRVLQSAVTLTPIAVTSDYMLSGGLVECKNFILAVRGPMNLSTVVVEATTSGVM